MADPPPDGGGGGRWTQAAAALYLQAGAGLQDAFSVYAFQYRAALHLTEFQLAGLASAKDAGSALFGLAFGFAFDDAPAAGPILASAVLNAGGFLAIRACYSGALVLSYPGQLVCFACAYACGSGYALGGLKYTFSNFPDVRGMVAAFLKPMDGLSAALYTQAGSLLALRVPAFLALQALVPSLTSLATLPFMRLHVSTEDSVAERTATIHTFEMAAAVTLLLALSLLVLSLLEAPHAASHDSLPLLRLLALAPLALLASYAALPWLHDWWRGAHGADPAGEDVAAHSEQVPLAASDAFAGYHTMEAPRGVQHGDDPGGDVDTGGCCAESDAQPHDTLTDRAAGGDGAEQAGVGSFARTASDANVFGAGRFYVTRSSTVGEALRTLDFWLTTSIYVFNNAIAGSVLNNVGPLLASLGTAPLAPVLIAVASCANCLGRIVGGQVSERTLFGFTAAEYYRPPGRLFSGPASVAAAQAVLAARRGGIPRSAWLLLNCAVQAAGCATLAAASSGGPLFLGLSLVTSAYGSQNTLIVSVFHERFGHRHYGALLGCAGLCILPVSVALSTLLASALYDAAAERQHQVDGYCTGPACFQAFLFCLTALAALNAALALMHLGRFGAFYRRLAARRAEDRRHKHA